MIILRYNLFGIKCFIFKIFILDDFIFIFIGGKNIRVIIFI